MTSTTLARTTLAGFVSLSLLSAAACAQSAPTHSPAPNGCPVDAPLALFAGIDMTGSGNYDGRAASDLATVEAVAVRAATCAGELIVVAHSSSSGSTVTLFEGSIEVRGATEAARARKAPEAVEAIMPTIEAAYEAASSILPTTGSDVLGMFSLVAEVDEQFPDAHLEATLISDGVDTVSFAPSSLTSSDEAVAAADQLPVPDLTGVEMLTMIGIGHVAGEPLTTTTVEAMKVAYERFGERSGAAQTLVVTERR